MRVGNGVRGVSGEEGGRGGRMKGIRWEGQ
jgi:hypothetical protein